MNLSNYWEYLQQFEFQKDIINTLYSIKLERRC